jgi:excisionase family DNA binding protein
MDIERDFVTMTEAASLLGISMVTMWAWVKMGRLIAYQMASDRRKKLLRRVDVDALATQRAFPCESITHGPVTYTYNGRGVRPWLPEMTAEPGWVYRVSPPMTNTHTPMCWRCAVEVSAQHEGQARVFWEEDPPSAEEWCRRCERGFGERPG